MDRLLAAGRPVTVLARRPNPDLERRGVRCIRGDLADGDAVAAACRGVDTVFHTAAKVSMWGRPAEFHRVNVLGTRTLLGAARAQGVRQFVYTSTPAVVYNGRDLAGGDETLPLATRCPSHYPLTKAAAEREVREANSPGLRTVALRPHLILGEGDPHLLPRVLARARAGRLHIVGTGRNRVDLLHVENAADAHLLAELALLKFQTPNSNDQTPQADVGGKAYFITNGEPVVLWEWINALLRSLGLPTAERHVPLAAATAAGVLCEWLWRLFPLRGDPPMTRFIAQELALDHWFDITAARRDLGYAPRISMAESTARLIEHLRARPG